MRCRGFNIVELMVAMVAGLLLVAAVSSLFVTVLRADQTVMQVSRLNQELQSVTDQIADDIQRAGYDALAVTRMSAVSSSCSSSPFCFDPTAGLPTSSCISLKYDDNANGVLDNSDDSRVYYYNPQDKAIRRSNINSLLCKGGENISSEDTIEISTLSFTMLSGSVSTGARTIRLVISGNDKQSPALKLTLQRDVKLRNDGY